MKKQLMTKKSENRVPAELYMAVRTADDKLVGMIDLRHHIDHPILGLWGGHMVRRFWIEL